MKLRVRLQNTTKTVELGDSSANYFTLDVLKERIREEFKLIGCLELSLNKKDVLEGEDDVRLSEFSLVSGDLVHVLASEAAAPPPVPALVSLPALVHDGQDQRLHSESDNTHDTDSCIGKPRDAGTSSSPTEFATSATSASEDPMEGSSEDPIEGSAEDPKVGSDDDPMDGSAEDPMEECQPPVNDPRVNRCLQEPLQCCESTDTAVPTHLSSLFMSTSHRDHNDRLWIVVHALMLESGLQPIHSGVGSDTMPDNWRQGTCYSTKYRLPESDEVTCSVTGVTIGSFCVVHGSLAGQAGEDANTQCKVMIKSGYYVALDAGNDAASSYRHLKILSRNIKNSLSLPLIREMRAALGYPDGSTLISLTQEVKLKILCLLDHASLLRMDQTCQHFHCLARDRAVWRHRYLRDYGSRADNSLSQNWYSLYKIKFKAHKEHLKILRQRFLTPLQMWCRPRPHPPWAPVHPYNGGIVGGDYDLIPQFPGGPDPFNRHGHNPIHPLRPRFNPFGPLPDQNIFPGPSGGRRGSGGWMGGFGGPRFF